MPEQGSEKHATPWHAPVAVEDVAESGARFKLMADPDTRAALARLAGLRDLPRLEANFDVTRQDAGGLRVIGLVSATVGQTCVVTLEPIANEVEEAIDVLSVPQAAADNHTAEAGAKEKEVPREAKWNDPEPLIGGVVDLGALATEFLFLGLDPYPRKPGAVFQPPADAKPDEDPFAALAKLKGGQDGR
jgi:Large ribosomal RNA subunit accumulation protein YceD